MCWRVSVSFYTEILSLGSHVGLGLKYITSLTPNCSHQALTYGAEHFSHSFVQAARVNKISLYVVQVPYLEDSNTGIAMFETKKIIEYLEETYAVK